MLSNWLVLCVAIGLLLLVATTATPVSYAIVRADGPGAQEGKIFLVNRGEAREILDNVTVETMGYKVNELSKISPALLSQFRKGPPLSEIKFADHSPDEIMRVELALNRALQKQLILEYFDLGDTENPSVVKFHDRWLMTSSWSWGTVEGHAADGKVRYKWMNSSKYPIYSEEDYLGVTMGTSEFLENESEGGDLKGVDARVLLRGPNRLHVAFNNNHPPLNVMAFAEIVLDELSGKLKLDYFCNWIGYNQNSVEKNWGPFVYNHTVLYIQRMEPFHVVHVNKGGTDHCAHAESFSLSKEWSAPWWHWGSLRGGTNAILVGDVYLAFFHSSRMLEGNFMKTYFMGAFTFSSKPPFHVVSLAQVPIMDKKLYTGPWAQFQNRRIDYVAFPTTYFIDEDEIFLSIGHQDRTGFVLRMKIDEVMASMIPVEYND